MDEILKHQLDRTLEGTNFSSIGEKYEGKVRDCYVDDNKRRVIVVSDRISAFDVVLGTVPFKGQVLNQIAEYWFRESRHIAANHLLEVPDPNVMIGQECRPLRAEFVMRSYLTGVTATSIWRAYSGGARNFCGHELPEGMKKNQKLPSAILTPSTKAEMGEHDVSVSREQLIEMGHISSEDFDKAASLVEKLFAFGVERAAKRGLLLVDTKYEIGVSPTGEMMVIDEIHTPDSSRYWYADDYEERLSKGQEPRSLDKEYVRRWMSETHEYQGQGPAPALPDEVRIEAAKRYIAIYELITGDEFVPDLHSAPLERIAENLSISETVATRSK